LSEDLETDFVHECRRCGRWETSKKKWKRCEWESADLLGVVLKLIKIKKGGPMIKDASFVYTEEHSMRIKVKLLLEKEIVKNTSMSQTHVVEFEIKNRQCVDCEREFTPHTWNTVVQVRQRCEHARTFNQLESLLTKNKTLDKLLKVERQDEGIDFYFASKSSSARFIEYLKGWVVGKEKQSKHLVSHDANNSTAKYKYAIYLELCPLSRGDLVFLNKKLAKSLGGLPQLLLVTRVRSSVHLVDPRTGKFYELSREQYWKNPFMPCASYRQLREFVVMDDTNFPDLTVAQTRDLGTVDDPCVEARTHFDVEVSGEILAYDLVNTVIPALDEMDEEERPNLILVQCKSCRTILVTPDREPLKGQKLRTESSYQGSSRADQIEVLKDFDGMIEAEPEEVEELIHFIAATAHMKDEDEEGEEEKENQEGEKGEETPSSMDVSPSDENVNENANGVIVR